MRCHNCSKIFNPASMFHFADISESSAYTPVYYCPSCWMGLHKEAVNRRQESFERMKELIAGE